MKIIVLIKQVPDTSEDRRLDSATGLLDRSSTEGVIDEVNERGLEVALQYKDSHKGTEVVALSMGPQGASQALRKALSMGADSAIHVLDDDLSGADAVWTSKALSAALKTTAFDLVVAGNESTDGRSGSVPAMVAERLALPLLGSIRAVDIHGTSVTGQREVESGTLSVRASLPAVITVTERSAEARFPNFKGILTAKRKPVKTLSLADLNLDPSECSAAARSVVVSVAARPARQSGKKIIDSGTAGVELAEYLGARQLL
ncbi:electron transfer flavoprotein subunit beta/FixA family protein [Arthrobacter sp. alpha11c]